MRNRLRTCTSHMPMSASSFFTPCGISAGSRICAYVGRMMPLSRQRRMFFFRWAVSMVRSIMGNLHVFNPRPCADRNLSDPQLEQVLEAVWAGSSYSCARASFNAVLGLDQQRDQGRAAGPGGG